MNGLYELLLTVSNALLVPDLLAAFGLAVLVLVELGLLLAEVVQRAADRAAWKAMLAALHERDAAVRRNELERYLTLPRVPRLLRYRLSALGAQARHRPARELALDEAELDAQRALSRLTLCIRLGPMVGLVGTLIPLGPGLTALAQGDVAQMAKHLTVAFTVTVLGLATGALGFALASLRRGLGARDLAQLHFVAGNIEELGP